MFYSIENLASHQAQELLAPWEIKDTSPRHLTKAEYGEWCRKPDTKHCFISGWEGVSPNVRVDQKNNPPYRLHAIVADYDMKLPENPVEYVKGNAVSTHLPAWLAITHQGRGRMVWVFESPVLFSNMEHMTQFFKILNKEIGLSKLHGGLETDTLASVKHYFELGRKWLPVAPRAVLPEDLVHLWYAQAAKDIRFRTEAERAADFAIPIEDLQQEVEKRWPGRWGKEFQIGAQGVRFWDPQADNQRAAIVCQDGMLCFTGPQSFVPWRQIFGAEYVKEYEVRALSDAAKSAYYDVMTQKFLLKDGKGRWRPFSEGAYTNALKVLHHSAVVPKGKTFSKVNEIQHYVRMYRNVDGTLPILYQPHGIITCKRKQILNTNEVTPVAPAPPYTPGPAPFKDGSSRFPFLYSFFKTFFADGQGRSDDDEQLPALLAWMKHFYVNAVNQTPKPGQAIVIAGEPGKGKSLFIEAILGGLMGGAEDAAGFFLGESKWTDNLIDAPVWKVDDRSVTQNYETNMKFADKIKKLVADPEAPFKEKFGSEMSVPFHGRIVIGCNLDEVSLRIIPPTDISNKEKISLFKTSTYKVDFGEREEIAAVVKQELPNFARFLYDWEIPERWVSKERRFGVEAYHHPELSAESRHEQMGFVVEMVSDYLTGYFEQHPKELVWRGTATQLYKEMDAESQGTTRAIKLQTMASQLGRMHTAGYGLYKTRVKNANIWTIKRDLAGNV